MSSSGTVTATSPPGATGTGSATAPPLELPGPCPPGTAACAGLQPDSACDLASSCAAAPSAGDGQGDVGEQIAAGRACAAANFALCRASTARSSSVLGPCGCLKLSAVIAAGAATCAASGAHGGGPGGGVIAGGTTAAAAACAGAGARVGGGADAVVALRPLLNFAILPLVHAANPAS